MRADIHPKYEKLVATCSCGNVIETRSALGKETIYLDVCSACHPFYTGKQKNVDTGGRIDNSNNVLLVCLALSSVNTSTKQNGLMPVFVLIYKTIIGLVHLLSGQVFLEIIPCRKRASTFHALANRFISFK